ncbi:MAG: hypothetical protein HYS08_00195 [Chlamydiae bacterium]|nr:hypothetical protein [Chlamydiota bacterium]MBI3266951.1 hypothetical protein [Chlamydiota bacterium]
MRKTIAPRDFYDLDFILRHGFNMADKEEMVLFDILTLDEQKNFHLDTALSRINKIMQNA